MTLRDRSDIESAREASWQALVAADQEPEAFKSMAYALCAIAGYLAIIVEGEFIDDA